MNKHIIEYNTKFLWSLLLFLHFSNVDSREILMNKNEKITY